MHNCYSLGCIARQVPNPKKVRLLATALAVIGGFSVAELTVSYFSHSLSLRADAGHLFSDTMAIALALLATRIAQKAPSASAPFGYRRVEVLAALGNGVGLLVMAGLISWEAIRHLQAPPTEILSLPMLATAIIGLGINSLNAFWLHQASQDDLNIQGVFLHVVADAISSVGVIFAAIAVGTLHWNWADGFISLGVGCLIALSGIPLVRQSLPILLERTPQQLDPGKVQTYLKNFAEVETVDDLKIWVIAPGQTVLLAHLKVTLQDGKARDKLLYKIQTRLQREFGIQDIFVQMTAVAPTATGWLEIGKDDLTSLVARVKLS
ncbi:MAG: cation diffusion facilitator family transporter [Xenococcaceae cyanobacterium]